MIGRSENKVFQEWSTPRPNSDLQASTPRSPMAALALHPTRNVFQSLRLNFERSLLRTNFLPAVFGASRTLNWSLQSLLGLFPSIVLAVPKSKVSHSRKAMRSANKGLKDKHSASCIVTYLPLLNCACQTLSIAQDAVHPNLHTICAQNATASSVECGRER